MIEDIFENAGRIIVVTGHYGSGKTEFSVSLAMLFSSLKNRRFEKLAVIDLDIVNPYFRSREQRELLENAGVSVYGSAYNTEITAELPALGADVKTPLEDSGCRVIIDAGGNDAGAIVLNQFSGHFGFGGTSVLAVINASRPETRDVEGALEHIYAIESATGLVIDGIVNNSHLLRETTAETIFRGQILCKRVCELSGKKYWCDCYPAEMIAERELNKCENLMPLGLYMRPTWLDK